MFRRLRSARHVRSHNRHRRRRSAHRQLRRRARGPGLPTTPPPKRIEDDLPRGKFTYPVHRPTTAKRVVMLLGLAVLAAAIGVAFVHFVFDQSSPQTVAQTTPPPAPEPTPTPAPPPPPEPTPPPVAVVTPDAAAPEIEIDVPESDATDAGTPDHAAPTDDDGYAPPSASARGRSRARRCGSCDRDHATSHAGGCRGRRRGGNPGCAGWLRRGLVRARQICTTVLRALPTGRARSGGNARHPRSRDGAGGRSERDATRDRMRREERGEGHGQESR